MSRSKLTRALLAAASLLAAVPLMAQSRPAPSAATTSAGAASTPAPAFPYGKYTLRVVDSTHAPPPGLVVEFADGTLSILNGDQLIEAHGMSVIGDQWQTYALDGDCQEVGTYTWHLDGKEIWLELVSDPCTQRAQSITAVRFVPKT